MAAPPSEKDPEETPEPPAEPVSRAGDLWILGRHRLLCGDSTVANDVTRALDGARPKLMCSDPPYGVDYDANWRNEADRANGKAYGASAIGTVHNDGRSDWTEAWKLFSGDVVYCWHADRHASTVQASLESAGFEIVCQIIWAKNRLIISRGDYHWKHEPCWYAVRKGKKHQWNGDRSQTTLWEIEHAKRETGHSTQKPIECMRRPIQNNSKPGDSVYEPFAGSGTTIIACEMMNRACRAIELSPAYVDVCVQRWQTYAGKKATLAGDGRSFDEVAKERKKGGADAKGRSRKSVLRRDGPAGAVPAVVEPKVRKTVRSGQPAAR
jgi:DNA modification methylase